MFYNFFLFLSFFLFLPKYFFHKKPLKLFERLGLRKYWIKIPNGKKLIWVHASSLGELKAASGLIKSLKEHGHILVSVFSDTGYKEAKSMSFVDDVIYLPVDFSFVMRPLLKSLKPYLVVIVETEFWYNFLRYAKFFGAKVVLVSGKLSQRSFKRYKKLSFFFRKVFSYIDHFIVQNTTYATRFENLGIGKEKISVGGNLKFDFSPPTLSNKEEIEFKNKLMVTNDDIVVTIASTHHPEEQMLLSILTQVAEKIGNLKVLLAPRHPNRFLEVEKILKEKKTAYCVLDNVKDTARVILVNKMGMLNSCYQVSNLAIVGGSFISHIGGHNILEPIFFRVPVIFGPYMEKQYDLVNNVLHYNCGKQIPIGELANFLLNIFTKKTQLNSMRANCEIFLKNKPHALNITLKNLVKHF